MRTTTGFWWNGFIVGAALAVVVAAMVFNSVEAETGESTQVTVNGFGSWEEAYEDARKKWKDDR